MPGFWALLLVPELRIQLFVSYFRNKLVFILCQNSRKTQISTFSKKFLLFREISFFLTLVKCLVYFAIKAYTVYCILYILDTFGETGLKQSNLCSLNRYCKKVLILIIFMSHPHFSALESWVKILFVAVWE